MEQDKTGKSRSFADALSDRFADAWKLLSETSRFLERTSEFPYYEEQLRSWRLELQSSSKGGDVSRRVRQEITELRKSLRQQGYDLSLAKQNLVVEGFRNDASLGEGFRRVVIYFCEEGLFWLSGENNHITLADLLERQLQSRLSRQKPVILSRHYLWYRRKGNDLILSGSDSEAKEDYERFRAMAETNSLQILSGLKELR